MSFAKVATLCEAGEVYLAQHMGEQGRWVSSTDKKSCMTDKLEILEYCKKVIHTESWFIGCRSMLTLKFISVIFERNWLTVKNTVQRLKIFAIFFFL